jgi:vacuolar protein sorting-associated protein 72
MAASRDRRGNAGTKMAKLLNEEEEDEFYKTTYGGFEEVEDDKVRRRGEDVRSVG